MRRLLLTITGLLSLSLASPTTFAGEDHPLCKDKTGMKWVLPFKAAQAQAKESGRLLMIKPVAFGTDRAGGW